MEEAFRLLIKTLTEPVQAVFIAWIIAMYWDKKEQRIISAKREEVEDKRTEAFIGMAKTVDIIMNKISGGQR